MNCPSQSGDKNLKKEYEDLTFYELEDKMIEKYGERYDIRKIDINGELEQEFVKRLGMLNTSFWCYTSFGILPMVNITWFDSL